MNFNIIAYILAVPGAVVVGIVTYYTAYTAIALFMRWVWRQSR